MKLNGLIVEDDESAAKELRDYIISTTVNSMVFGNVDIAVTGQEAVELGCSHRLYDVGIFDLKIPWCTGDKTALVENGRKAIMEVARHQTGMCMLALSAHGTIERAFAVGKVPGMLRFLVKPMRAEDVIVHMANAMDEARRASEASCQKARQTYLHQAHIHTALNALNTMQISIQAAERVCSPSTFVMARDLPNLRECLGQVEESRGLVVESLRLNSAEMSVSRETLDLRQPIQDGSRIACLTWPDKAHLLDLELDEKPLEVYGIREELSQVSLNLLGNALQACKAQERVRASAHRDTGSTVFTVTNCNQTIPSEDLDSVFDPGYSTKANEGHGYGLTLARHFVWNHGGTIVCTTDEEAGTTFTVRIPAREESRGE